MRFSFLSRIIASFATVVFCLLGTVYLQAATNDEPSDGVSEKARMREYPGGKEEEDLKVQEHLVEPVSTFNKAKIQSKYFQKTKTDGTEEAAPPEEVEPE